MKQDSLVRGSLWMFSALGGRILIQAISFVIVARVLGVQQYGAFVGIVALIGVLTPFSGLGSGSLLIKNVARDERLLNVYWGNALLVTSVSGTLLVVVLLVLARLVVGSAVSTWIVLFLSAAEFFFARIVDTAAQAFQTVHAFRRTAQLHLVLGMTRLGGALILWLVTDHAGLSAWASLYWASSLLSAALAVLLVTSSLGPPRVELRRISQNLVEGVFFSVGTAAQTIYNDVDKTMLAKLGTLEATGAYAAAYRLVDVAYIPVRSLLYASYSRFFQHGAEGLKGAKRYALRLLPFAMGYGALAAAGLFFLAPVIPLVLGSEFGPAQEALRWLALIPFLRSLHFFAADTLTGAGFQGLRSLVQIAVAVVNFVFNIWLIPTYSWRGAAWASIASDSLLVIALWSAVSLLQWKGEKPRMKESMTQ